MEGILTDLMAVMEYNKLADGGASHQLPPGVMARKEGDPSWRDQGNFNPPDKDNKDWILGKGSNREKMLKVVMAKLLLNHLTDKEKGGLTKLLHDSLMETQKVNLDNRINGHKAPTMLMMNYKW